MKARLRIEEHNDALALGLILSDALLFSKFFQSKDLSLEPTVPQKLMFLDYSKRVLACTSRNVAKTVCIIGKILRMLCTYLPKENTRDDEALIFTPAESHLNPLVDRLFGHITQVPMFMSLVKSWNKGDKPKIVTKTGLNIQFRIEGSSGTDTNMVGLHPGQIIIGDEIEFGNWICHRSRAGGAMPHTKWFYAGVPNGVQGTVFHSLDQTKEGNTWSRHKFSMLTANPIFLRSKKYRKEIEAAFGGKNSQQYLTQALGLWGSEMSGAFPPGSISWNKNNDYPYYSRNLSGTEIAQAVRDDKLWVLLKVPSVKTQRAVCGFDYGHSPDPSTLLVAIKKNDESPWQTYCRISMYNTLVQDQLEVLKVLAVGVLDHKITMVSVDNEQMMQAMISNQYKHLFDGRVKLTNQAGTSEVNLETWRVITDETKDDPITLEAKARGQVTKIRRKYFLTESFKRMMTNMLMGRANDLRVEIGYDAEFESELMQCTQRKTEAGYVVYEVQKSRNSKTSPDQIIDAARAMADCITTTDGTQLKISQDLQNMISSLGWAGKKKSEWSAPWSH